MVALQGAPCVRIFPGMKPWTAWVHFHRKYSTYRHEINNAQPAGASGVWFYPQRPKDAENWPNTAFCAAYSWRRWEVGLMSYTVMGRPYQLPWRDVPPAKKLLSYDRFGQSQLSLVYYKMYTKHPDMTEITQGRQGQALHVEFDSSLVLPAMCSTEYKLSEIV